VTPAAFSRNGVPIRLTEERWAHIVEEHGEMQGLGDEILRTIAAPDRVLAGGFGELLQQFQFSCGVTTPLFPPLGKGG
jgi:hypothetical protein